MTTPIGSDKINGNFNGKDILSSEQFSKQDLQLVLQKAEEIKHLVLQKGGTDLLKNKIMAALFFEPSSRTFGSFVAGMQRLGGGFIPLQAMAQSSVAKGETLEDTIQTFSAYSDVIVMRHPELGSMQRAARVTTIPIINAGEGIGEHPTQALYDLYTIQEELGKLENLHITFLGELAHYRPVNSLAKVLTLFPNITMSFISPPEVSLNAETKRYLTDRKVSFNQDSDIHSVIGDTDVLYVTRVKKEFMPVDLYNKVKGKYVVDNNLASHMKKRSIIMHALPRIDEIHTEIDGDPRAVYLRSQVQNGMYVRMALLGLVLGKL